MAYGAVMHIVTDHYDTELKRVVAQAAAFRDRILPLDRIVELLAKEDWPAPKVERLSFESAYVGISVAWRLTEGHFSVQRSGRDHGFDCQASGNYQHRFDSFDTPEEVVAALIRWRQGAREYLAKHPDILAEFGVGDPGTL